MTLNKEPRITKQRLAITKILTETTDFVSAQQLHQLINQTNHNVSLATVYRTLQNMGEEKQLDILRNQDGELIYRRCASKKHHHHLICCTCGKTKEISEENLENYLNQTAKKNGYTQISHTLEIFGICPTCTKQKTTTPTKLN